MRAARYDAPDYLMQTRNARKDDAPGVRKNMRTMRAR